MKTLNEVWRDHNAQFERALAALYADPDEPQRRLFESMSYSLNAGGKRLRPFLAALFCAACGRVSRDAVSCSSDLISQVCIQA